MRNGSLAHEQVDLIAYSSYSTLHGVGPWSYLSTGTHSSTSNIKLSTWSCVSWYFCEMSNDVVMMMMLLFRGSPTYFWFWAILLRKMQFHAIQLDRCQK